MSCIYSFDGYQKKGIDPNISGKKSLAQSNIRISSYRRFKMSAYGKQAENVSFINFRPLYVAMFTLNKNMRQFGVAHEI